MAFQARSGNGKEIGIYLIQKLIISPFPELVVAGSLPLRQGQLSSLEQPTVARRSGGPDQEGILLALVPAIAADW
jgi:hypothetical protein